MVLAAKKTPIIAKTEELCQTILEQASFKELKAKIETFTNDEAAQKSYMSLVEKQEQLQAKQQQGEQLTDAEIDAFEKERESLFSNPVAKDFIDAQQALHKMQETVNQYITKTIELDRVPEESDFKSGGCGPHCGCSG